MSTRRLFVKLGAISGAATLIPRVLHATTVADGERRAVPASTGTRGRFAAQVGRRFVVETGDGTQVPLLLVDVSDPAVLSAPGFAGHPECFSASFRGPVGAPLRQGTYAVSNDGLGRFSLFLVPVGPSRRGMQEYEAVFNCAVPD